MIYGAIDHEDKGILLQFSDLAGVLCAILSTVPGKLNASDDQPCT